MISKAYVVYSKIKGMLYKYRNKNIIYKDKIIVQGYFPTIKVLKNAKLNLGSNVKFNSDFKISWGPMNQKCKISVGYDANMVVGDNTEFNGCTIACYKNISLGVNCIIASGVFIADTDLHSIDAMEREKQLKGKPYNKEYVKRENVVIGDNVWICYNAIILKGTKIGDNCIIGAGSVVKGEFPNNVVISGNPAKAVKKLY